MAGNDLTPLLSREEYRSLYLDSLRQQSRMNAFNLQANIDWAQTGDTEQEAALAATLQGMSTAAIDAEAKQYLTSLVRANDLPYVLARMTVDMKKFLILKYANVVGQLSRMNIPRPTSGITFLEVFMSLYQPIKPEDRAASVAQVARQVAEAPLSVSAIESASQMQSPHSTALQTPEVSDLINLSDMEPSTFSKTADFQTPSKGDTTFSNQYGSFISPIAKNDMSRMSLTPGSSFRSSRATTVPDFLNSPFKDIQEAVEKGFVNVRKKGQRGAQLFMDSSFQDPDMSIDLGASGPVRGLVSPDKNRPGQIGSRDAARFKQPRSGGRGRKSKSQRKYLVGAGMMKEGPVEASHGWQQFGKYMLARNDLDHGDLCHIRYQSGQKIKKMPNRVVGAGVKAVLSSIADGKHPKYEDVEKLEDDEKEYIRGLLKSASIDPTSVPEAKKDDKEKLKHQFEKMKGEIVAGNDNPQLIKEFKLALLKMKQNKMLPTGQVNEILLELATLGH